MFSTDQFQMFERDELGNQVKTSSGHTSGMKGVRVMLSHFFTRFLQVTLLLCIRFSYSCQVDLPTLEKQPSLAMDQT